MGQVTTDYVINITKNHATCGYTVTAGGSVGRGIELSDSAHNFIRFYPITPSTGTGFTEDSATALNSNTNYYIRAFEDNGSGKVYGGYLAFKTYSAGTGSYPYQCDLRNDHLTDVNTLQFDVYIYSTNSGNLLYLNNYQLGFELNNVGNTAGTFTGTYVSLSSDLPSGFLPATNIIFRVDGTHFDMVIPGPAASSSGTLIPYTATGSGTRIGTFQVVHHTGGSITPFPAGVQLQMVADFDVLGKTIIYATPGATGTPVNTTNSSSHAPREPITNNNFLPSNNYMCQALNWKGTTDQAWLTQGNWVQNPSTIAFPPSSSSLIYIEGYGVTNAPVVSTSGGSAATCGNLTIDNGTTSLTISSGGQLTVNGNLVIGTTSSAPITIQSDGTGAGSLITVGTISGTGAANCQVQRYMTGDWTSGPPTLATTYHIVSAPVLNPSNSLFNGSLMDKWDETAQSWVDLTLPYENLTLGKGYMVAPASPGITATFTGSLNTGDQTITGLTRTGATTYSGFNLEGNPFPSAIKWDNSISITNLDDFAWYWNGSAYISLARSTGTGIIAAEQGFFVRVLSGSGSFTIPNLNRTHSATTFYKSTVTDLLTLRVEGNSYWDQTQVRFLPDATDDFNVGLDAYKMMGSVIAPQLFTYKQNTELSILSLPTLSVYPIVKVGFLPGTAGNFTIKASDFESFASGTNFYLEDLVTGNKQDLKSNPTYTFNADPSEPEHRFNLHFAALGVDQKESGNIKIYSYAKDIYVNIPETINGDIIVYNILGSEIHRQPITGNSLNKISLNLMSGYYIVKVVGDSQTLSRKVFIQ